VHAAYFARDVDRAQNYLIQVAITQERAFASDGGDCELKYAQTFLDEQLMLFALKQE